MKAHLVFLVLAGGASAPALLPGAPASSVAMTTAAPALAHLTLTRGHTFSVSQPLAQAFTFFEPIGEKRWAAGWDPVFVSADAAALSDNTVFLRETAHDGHAVTSIWLITRYEPAAGLIEYRTIIPGLRVSRITVQCRATDATTTSVEVTYRHNSLSDAGDRFIAELTEEKYRASIEEWGSAIRDYLAHGAPAAP